MSNIRFLKYLWFLPGQTPPLMTIYLRYLGFHGKLMNWRIIISHHLLSAKSLFTSEVWATKKPLLTLRSGLFETRSARFSGCPASCILPCGYLLQTSILKVQSFAKVRVLCYKGFPKSTLKFETTTTLQL